MDRRRKFVLAAGAVLLVGVPTGFVVQDRIETAERESLERAVEDYFQSEVDRDIAKWRADGIPDGRVWSKFDAEAFSFDVTRDGARATVDVNQKVTPYTTDESGGDLRAEVPAMATRVLVFESSGDTWRMVEDLTGRELTD
ncbi:hypothetical protein [Streptomyces sp. N35]|uniref:hypothetical protein n=1 Tax=Streptomyces sp. N35 TaxID=2795730 RepID=UPI0018F6C9C5|nr:hypothetical protein [Streptomyces sp. N35]